MNLDSNQEAFQFVFDDPKVDGIGIVRLDFILESDEVEMYNGFSNIYSGEVDEYYSSQLIAGSQTTVEYYDSDPVLEELTEFSEVKTILYRVHDHIIDSVTFAKLSRSQIGQLKTSNGNDYIWELQRKLNVFHDALPTISGRLKDQRQSSLAHLLLVSIPNSVPVTYSENGFDQKNVEEFIESFDGLQKLKFTGSGPVTGLNPAHPAEYLLTPQTPNNIWGPLSIITLRHNTSHIVEPSWLPGLHALIPYFRAFDWVNYRWEQLDRLYSDTYELSSVFGEAKETLTPSEYRDAVLEVRRNWSEVNQAQDELRKFNDFVEDIPGDGMQDEIPPSEENLSYGSGLRIGSPLLQAYSTNLIQGFEDLQSDLDRVEEKQGTVLRYLQAEVSAESSIRNLSLQRRVLILTGVLTLLTVVLAVGNEFTRTSIINIFEAGFNLLKNFL